MSAYEVLFTDRHSTTVEIAETGNPMRDEHRAMFTAEDADTAGRRAFSARPVGCTGINWRTHQGYSCPIHKEA